LEELRTTKGQLTTKNFISHNSNYRNDANEASL